ncbi:hypothetical protein shim_07610 [Shimia sp. SK013]|nr:hypothetical protein shim_07610 [Shimia sp. SK013]
MNEHELYQEVETKVEAFSDHINNLDHTLRSIPDETLRKTALRSLGDLMGNLETITYEFRKHLGTTTL